MDEISKFLTQLGQLGALMTMKYVLIDPPEWVINKFRKYNYEVVRDIKEAERVIKRNGYIVVLIADDSIEDQLGDHTYMLFSDIEDVDEEQIPIKSICCSSSNKRNYLQGG